MFQVLYMTDETHCIENLIFLSYIYILVHRTEDSGYNGKNQLW